MDPIPPQKSLTELTAERIREAIILGTFPLGTKLSEQKLADQLQISRSPVREALVLLQIEGLVQIFPKRGSFVCAPDEAVTRDLCEHRNVVETACLALAIERNHDALMEEMRLGMSQMDTAVRRADTRGYSQGDLRFHRAIIANSGNRSMSKVYESTIGPLMALRTHIFTITGIALDRSMQEHAEILDACAKKDIARAQAFCTRHIFHLAEHFHDDDLSRTR